MRNLHAGRRGVQGVPVTGGVGRCVPRVIRAVYRDGTWQVGTQGDTVYSTQAWPSTRILAQAWPSTRT